MSGTEQLHIAISGNIGAGKTSLTALLEKEWDWKADYESVEDNPYLNDFYLDMRRWSFNLQVYFLNSRFRQYLRIRDRKTTVVQDRTIYEDAHIFARNLHDMGLMTGRDYENYRSIFSTVMELVTPPDLLIYLRAGVPTLVRQIQKRGREYEKGIRIDYLEQLNNHYEQWIAGYRSGPVMIVNVDEFNFVERPQDKKAVLDQISEKVAQLGPRKAVLASR